MPAWASKACKHVLQWHTFSENLLLLLEGNCWFFAFHAGSDDALHAMKAAGFFLAASTLLWTEALMSLFFSSQAVLLGLGRVGDVCECKLSFQCALWLSVQVCACICVCGCTCV